MIGVATHCFNKFGFNGLINLLVSLGLSASYDLRKKCSLVNIVQMGSRWGVGTFKDCVSSFHKHNPKWLFHCVYINPYCHWKVQINESERLCCDIWPAIVLEGSGYCCLSARIGQYCCKTCWFPSLDLTNFMGGSYHNNHGRCPRNPASHDQLQVQDWLYLFACSCKKAGQVCSRIMRKQCVGTSCQNSS